jgi:hypothetical protein
MEALLDRSLNKRFDLDSRLGPLVCPAYKLDIEKDVPACEPRGWIEQLHLNSASTRALGCRSGQIRIERAGAQIVDHRAMLLFDPVAQALCGKFIGIGKMLIIRGSPKEDTAVLVHRRVDDRVCGPAIFGLNVEDLRADLDVRVKPGTHIGAGPEHTARAGSVGELKNWEFI